MRICIFGFLIRAIHKRTPARLRFEVSQIENLNVWSTCVRSDFCLREKWMRFAMRSLCLHRPASLGSLFWQISEMSRQPFAHRHLQQAQRCSPADKRFRWHVQRHTTSAKPNWMLAQPNACSAECSPTNAKCPDSRRTFFGFLSVILQPSLGSKRLWIRFFDLLIRFGCVFFCFCISFF